MLHWLKKTLFGQEKITQPQRLFQKEEVIFTIFIQENKLVYHERSNQMEVDLNTLRYAYAELLGESAYLVLADDDRQHYVVCDQKGFMEVYTQLSENFNFDDDTFFSVAHQKQNLKARIWFRRQKKNYAFVPIDSTDYHEGFEVLSPKKHWFSWDTKYKVLVDSEIGHIEKTNQETFIFIFDFPVRIGPMVINNLKAYFDEPREDLAIQSYSVDIYDSTNTDSSYFYLKQSWRELIPMEVEEGYERDNQNYANFDFSGINLSISYTYGIGSGYDDGSTFFSITNRREYPDLLVDSGQYSIEKENCLVLNAEHSIVQDYRVNTHMKLRPEQLSTISLDKSVIWIDKVNQKIGFSDANYALIYSINELECIYFYNTLPAKGGGYSQFSIKIKEQEYPVTIYYGDCNEFDLYATAVSKLLKIEVVIPEPDYNC